MINQPDPNSSQSPLTSSQPHPPPISTTPVNPAITESVDTTPVTPTATPPNSSQADTVVVSTDTNQTPSTQAPLPQAQPAPISQPKEAEPISSSAETAPLVELHKDHELEPEVEGWLEKIERSGEVNLPEPVQDDHGNVVLADPSAIVSEEKIVLPLTETEVSKGMHAKITDSARWLATWCQRVIKMFGNQVQYASEKQDSNS